MPRQIRMSALAIALIVALSGFSLAQYHDDDDGYYHGNLSQARQYGYQQGYRDGYDKGRHEGRENDPNDFQVPDWRQVTRGYQQWMGPVEMYQNAYRDGYENGFRSGYESVNQSWRDRDGDRDEGIYNDGGYSNRRPGDWSGSNMGYRTGYQDGTNQASDDMRRNKPFNANPRGKYDDRDHGYRREYGDKNSYKAQYDDGYRASYGATFHRY